MSLAENRYRQFSSALVPNCGNMLGVRIPVLREIARECAASGRREFSVINYAPQSFEERMVEGISIGYMKLPETEMYKLVADFIPKIDNWSVCDSFCATLKFMCKNRMKAWNFIAPYFVSTMEFEARFARVVFLDFLISEEFIDGGLVRVADLRTRAQYAIMGAAWALSVCAVKFPAKTLEFLPKVEPVLRALTVRKICDSFRVSDAYKNACKATLQNRGVGG